MGWGVAQWRRRQPLAWQLGGANAQARLQTEEEELRHGEASRDAESWAFELALHRVKEAEAWAEEVAMADDMATKSIVMREQ
ncbi:hypothetical protein BHM03_00060350 [Ensete ventricosum]|nr:hypothetical protein BHM03_00060350 [Ensete ventricosum]